MMSTRREFLGATLASLTAGGSLLASEGSRDERGPFRVIELSEGTCWVLARQPQPTASTTMELERILSTCERRRTILLTTARLAPVGKADLRFGAWVGLCERYHVDLVIEGSGRGYFRTAPIRARSIDPAGTRYIGVGNQEPDRSVESGLLTVHSNRPHRLMTQSVFGSFEVVVTAGKELLDRVTVSPA